MKNVSKIIDRLSEVFQAKTKLVLAKKLGLPPSSVTDAIRRGTIPDPWLYKASYETRCRIEWLKDGELPKYIDEAVAEVRAAYGVKTLAGIDTLLSEWKNIEEPNRRLAELSMRAIALGEDIPMIEAVVTTALKKHQYDKAKKLAQQKKKKG